MKSFFYQSWQRLAATGVVAASLALLAGAAQAQAPASMALIGSDPTATAYTGPRFPGGPDSLQATLTRLLRPASPALAGQLFLHFELAADGTVQQAALLMPPRGTVAAALAKSKEAQTLMSQVAQRLPAWQPGTGMPGQSKAAANFVTLPLTFGPTTGPLALVYSDENPTFPAMGDRRFGIMGFLQRQVRYPAEDLRNRVQGTVYGYFEVSETGAIEQRRIVGSVSPTLDAEVLHALQLLPNALTPPRLGGRPVRVGYVVPMAFKSL
jgi:protein TonB